MYKTVASISVTTTEVTIEAPELAEPEIEPLSLAVVAVESLRRGRVEFFDAVV